MAKKKTSTVKETLMTSSEVAAFLYKNSPELREAYTQADIELALDDRGWLVGGKAKAGELDPLSRTVQINKSRYYWLRDPLAHQAVRLWTDYGLGDTAITYQSDDAGVMKKLDKFTKDRRNRKLLNATGMKRLSTKLLVDGELFFAVYSDGVIRTFDPLQITDILCDEDDDDTVLAYRRVTANNKTLYYRDWTADPKDAAQAKDPITKQTIKSLETDCQIYHLPFDAFEKRGTGIFGCCVNWSREHRRFMEARVAITQALATWAHKMTVKGGQAQLNRMKAQLESTFAQTGTQGGTERNPQPAPGSTFFQNDGVDLQPTGRTTGAGDAKTDGEQLKLMVAAGTGIMLHYFGDPSTGNLATATAMELPMLKMFASYQKLWKDAMRDIYTIILDEDPDKDPADIEVELPPILVDDLAKLGTFLTSFTTMFPEAKTDSVLRLCLNAMGVEDIDDVLEEIKKNKVELEAKAADNVANGLNQDGSPIKPTVVAKPGATANPGDKNADNQEALAEMLRELIEKL